MATLLIPDISQKIGNKIRELNLQPQIWPKEFIIKTRGRRHRYSSVCLNQEGKKLIFYAGFLKDAYERGRMKTEIELAKIFIKEPLFKYFPKYFQSGMEKEFGWLTREYYPDFPIEDKEKIEKLKRPLNEKEIKKLAQVTVKMFELPVKRFPFLKPYKIKRYLRTIKATKDLMKQGIFSQQEYKELKKLIERNKKTLKQECKYFSHGDFQIGNIIIFDEVLKIVDLESAEINNFAFDISFLTTKLWQDSETRKKLINYYFGFLKPEKRDLFRILFRIDCLGIGLQSYYSQPLEYSPEQLKTRKQYYTKFLKACSHGFEELANL